MISPFELKTEGFDPDVLDGATEQLRQQRIRYLLFEYNSLWSTTLKKDAPEEDKQRKLLSTVTRKLDEAGYACMLVGPRTFVPVTPPSIWLDKMEFRGWSNVFCGRVKDPEFCEVAISASDPSRKPFMESYFYLLNHNNL